MSEFPKDGRFEYGKMDKQTGAQWVHVTPEMARAHPQGKLNLALWAIAAVFLSFGLLRLSVSAGEMLNVISGVLQIVTGLMLMMRAPWGIMIAGAQLILTIFGVVTSGFGGHWMDLVILLFSFGALFYLVEGDRPNLIYKHRYRSYGKGPKA